MRRRSISVTGGGGAVGRAVVKELEVNAEVRTLDVAPNFDAANYNSVNILDRKALRDAIVGSDTVVHIAALLQPTEDPVQMFNVNVVGTWNVLQAAEELGVQKVILISSECSTGIINIEGMRQPCPDYLPIDEDHPLRPLETYGMSKQLNEVTAQAFARRGKMQIVALRPTLVLVPGFQSYIRRVRNTDDRDLWSYVELCDVVTAVRLSLEYDRQEFDSFFLSALDTFSKEETLTFMRRKFKGISQIRKPEVYEENPYASIWDLSRSRERLGLRPASNWRRFIESDVSSLTGNR